MKRIISILFLTSLVLVTLSGVAQAAPEEPPGTLFGGGIPTGATTGAGFVTLIFNVIDWLFVVVLLAAVVFIVLAGLQFIQGGGDPSAVTQARNKLIWGVVGIAVAVFARTIPAVVRNIIGG